MNRKRLKVNLNREIYWGIEYCKGCLNNIHKDAVLSRMQFDWVKTNIEYALNYLKQL